MDWDNSGEDWRFSNDVLENFDGPIPQGFELTEEETSYAGLSNDPRMTAIIKHGGYSEIEHYDDMISRYEGLEGVDQDYVAQYKTEREAAILYYAEVEEWMPHYEEYLDQFQTEICMKLQQGELRARGTKLPNPDKIRTEEILDKLEKRLPDLPVVDIEPGNWISKTIDWEASSIYGRKESFVWIHFNTDEMLKSFPPTVLLKKEQLVSFGESFALASSAMTGIKKATSNRGRPSLPWTEFHVEIARMFRDNLMPKKKEAAIAELQGWFMKVENRSVSRAAIGERLKPYFDTLIKK